ncbi:hypothetical protein [Natronorubrum aibiense]|uniref:Uncharacterized protein n=1 Tax=Natronorubrum aibiense TaxID=348826 RepID=A0A5P9P6G2_9EURY|nr:hypothetical protein [Natronorubrum aibiense]QFU83676.1 hypothetical protein GCU68_14575 [Natronorubrum aibiense]
MTRNGIMGVIGVLSLGALVTANLGLYRVFSFIGAAFILAVIASATIERGDRDFDLDPYTGLIGGLTVFFLLGLGGIWLTWEPGVTEYTYVLGIPIPTLIYFGFIWLLPLTAAVYYSLIFDRIAGEEIVDDIIDSARKHQRQTSFPLAPEQPSRPTEVADGGEVNDE